MNKRLRSESLGRFFRKEFHVAFLLFLCLSSVLLSFLSGVSSPKTAIQAALASNSAGQSPVELIWEKLYGGTGDDRAFYAAKTEDGGFLIVGSTTPIFPGKTVGWIVRTDSSGNMLWNKSFLEGKGSEFRRAIKTDNGFLLVGNTFSVSGISDGRNRSCLFPRSCRSR